MLKYLGCVGLGVVVGYYIAQQRLEQHYYDDLARETAEARDFYRQKYRDRSKEAGEDPEVTESAIAAAEALERYQGITAGPGLLTEEVTATLERDVELEESARRAAQEAVQELNEIAPDTIAPIQPTKSVTTESLSEDIEKLSPKSGPVDYNQISTPVKEKTEVDPDRPHVITAEDFIKSETGFKQFSITYFAGDDILAGQSDNIIDGANRKLTLGDEIIQMLKDGPEAMGGMDVIFVRCPMMSYEFEIARSKGKYVDEVGPIPSSPSG